MEINICSISEKEYESLETGLALDLPLWIKPNSVKCYKNKEILAIYRKDKLVGVYVLPWREEDGCKFVERGYRFFPYLSPIIFEKNIEKRRSIIISLFKYIFLNYDAMYMPFAPDFKDISAVAELGGFFECRHTQVIKNELNLLDMSSKLRNHIKKAMSEIEIKVEYDLQNFNFELAIKGNKDERCSRKISAGNLLNNKDAKIYNAYHHGQVVAGILVCFDNKTATYLHSWQEANTPRGTVSYLLQYAINDAFRINHVKEFDLEGSVMHSIDKFFNNFGGEYVIYPYLHYAKKYEFFEKLINTSKDIEGRKSLDFGGVKDEH